MELSSIAKPYVNAILASASNDNSTQNWLILLKVCTDVMSNEAIFELTRSPKLGNNGKKKAMISLINSALGQNMNQNQARFIGLLVDNARLEALPAICQLFEKNSAKNSHSKTFTIQTAFALSQSEEQSLKEKLKGNAQGEIILESEVDASLMSGVIITEEDKVIDNTLKAKLNKLGFALQANT